MNFLDNAYNAAGPLRQKRKDEIIAYCRNPHPTAEDFAAIEDLTLNHAYNIRKALCMLEPSYEQSDRVPDGFTVARALKMALQT